MYSTPEAAIPNEPAVIYKLLFEAGRFPFFGQRFIFTIVYFHIYRDSRVVVLALLMGGPCPI